MRTVTFLLLRGLPASGKSTYAQTLVNQGWKRLNKDMMRNMIDGGQFTKENENHLNTLLYQMAEHYLQAGYNVVSDNMNFNPWHFMAANRLAKCSNTMKHDLGVEIKVAVLDFHTLITTCIERDAKREKPVTEKEIRFIYNQWIKAGEFPDVSLFVDDAKVFDESTDKVK